jgi:uncharacterized protein (DUF433 family)
MALVNHNYVKTDTDNPLEAYIEGKGYKAYLVANLAFNDSPEASANHYKLTLGQVYSAMAFYRDNEVAIDKSIEEMQQIGKELGARNASEHLAEIRARAKKS